MNTISHFSRRVGTSLLIIIGVFVFTMEIGGPIVLAKSITPGTDGLSHSEAYRIYTTTVYFPMIFAPRVVILCEGKVYEGYTKTLFTFKTEQDNDPAIQKVIRNCTFRNSSKGPIAFNGAQNVLIEGNTFENIRTNIPGMDAHAIDIRCSNPCNIDNVVIRNNSFKNIGADGIQVGENQRMIKNVIIQNNTFQGNDTTGENGIDIKGVDGPIYVLGNNISGFRPCEAPTSEPPGNQDCSGSSGEAMVIHAGEHSGSPSNVVVEGNRFYDSVYGLTINGNASNITVSNNDIFNNLYLGLYVNGGSNITIEGNKFSNNLRDLKVEDCTNCTIR